jgi:hypothetical protein
LALGKNIDELENHIPFDVAAKNFHSCARFGLDAQVRWTNGAIGIQTLLLDELLPKAKAALVERGLSRADLDHYFDDVLHRRVLTGRNGAQWQRAFVDTHGKDFQQLTERYVELQVAGQPVHEWPV